MMKAVVNRARYPKARPEVEIPLDITAMSPRTSSTKSAQVSFRILDADNSPAVTNAPGGTDPERPVETVTTRTNAVRNPPSWIEA